jgi:hypothetical protein
MMWRSELPTAGLQHPDAEDAEVSQKSQKDFLRFLQVHNERALQSSMFEREGSPETRSGTGAT